MEISPRSVSVAERIAELIRTGEVQPGQRLPSERQLALRLGVGRPSVREALRGLERSRIIDIRHRQGAFVNRFHPDQLLSTDVSIIARHVDGVDILHAVEVRRVVETALAGFAAERRDVRDLAALAANLERMRTIVAHEGDIISPDVEFHELIAVAAGNPVFARMLRSIRDLMIRNLEITSRTPAAPGKALAFHLGIYQAIELGDAPAARRAMDVHLDDVEAILRRELAQEEALDAQDRSDGGSA
jgi:GntR family transcriptional regulator, transcriptional repressor for pyruvate dehydrogenase complex